MFKSQKFKSILPYFLLALAVIVAYKIISELGFFINFISKAWSIISPFFYGFLLAYIINIPRTAIQKLLGKSKFKFISKRKKSLSLISVFIIVALLVFSILNLIIPAVYNSVSLFVSSLPAYYERTLEFVEYLNSFELFGIIDIDISIDGIVSMIQEQFQGFNTENLSSSIDALLGISSAIFGVSSAIFSGFLTVISSIYILIEKDKMKEFINRLLRAVSSSGFYSATVKYVGSLNKNFKLYIYTQTIDGCILGTIATVELLILGSPYALILGLILGIINYIPYFGSIFGSIIAIVIVAFTQNLLTAFITAVVLLITQQIDGNIIQPKLMGGSFSLSPLLVIVSITIGGAIAGIFGMIAAIPIVAVLKDMLESIIGHYEQKKFEKENMTPETESALIQEDMQKKSDEQP